MYVFVCVCVGVCVCVHGCEFTESSPTYMHAYMHTYIHKYTGLLCRPKSDSMQEQGFRRAKKLLGDVVRGREAGRYGCILIELGMCLLLDRSQGSKSVESKHESSLKLGEQLLCDLFHWQPHVRPQLLSTVFNSSVEHHTLPRYVLVKYVCMYVCMLCVCVCCFFLGFVYVCMHIQTSTYMQAYQRMQ
jgi:hypothetical protein